MERSRRWIPASPSQPLTLKVVSYTQDLIISTHVGQLTATSVWLFDFSNLPIGAVSGIARIGPPAPKPGMPPAQADLPEPPAFTSSQVRARPTLLETPAERSRAKSVIRRFDQGLPRSTAVVHLGAWPPIFFFGAYGAPQEWLASLPVRRDRPINSSASIAAQTGSGNPVRSGWRTLDSLPRRFPVVWSPPRPRPATISCPSPTSGRNSPCKVALLPAASVTGRESVARVQGCRISANRES